MILADENVYQLIILALREAGIEVYSVFENHRGVSDQDIVEASLQPPRIILTEDKDFGDLVFAHNQKPSGVILLRYALPEVEEISKALIRLLQTRGSTLFGKFVTVTARKTRIRSLV
jgi:predicted nuclease of predicted toxin-antitoxin system